MIQFCGENTSLAIQGGKRGYSKLFKPYFKYSILTGYFLFLLNSKESCISYRGRQIGHPGVVQFIFFQH